MNNRLPWRFSPKRFMSDTTLQSADLAVRGAWMQTLCILWKENQIEMTLSLEDWSRLWRCSYTEAERIINVLKELIARHEELLSLGSVDDSGHEDKSMWNGSQPAGGQDCPPHIPEGTENTGNSEESTTNRIWRATKKLPVATVRDHEGLITLAIPQPPPKKRKLKPAVALAKAGRDPELNPKVADSEHSRQTQLRNNGAILAIAEEMVQRREQRHRIEFVDVERLGRIFNERVDNKEDPLFICLHLASHLTRHGWTELSQAVFHAPAWMRVHQLCTDASPPEPRIWVV